MSTITNKSFDGVSAVMSRIDSLKQAQRLINGLFSLSTGETPKAILSMGYQWRRASSSEDHDAEALRAEIENADRVIRDRIVNALCEAENLLQKAMESFGITFTPEAAR